jgi:hypothetical protein
MTDNKPSGKKKVEGGSTEWLESLLYDRWERLRIGRPKMASEARF